MSWKKINCNYCENWKTPDFISQFTLCKLITHKHLAVVGVMTMLSVCVCHWLLSRLNMPLVCVCHECAVCVTHCTLMTDTHKRYTHTTEQYRQAHTLSIDMTHTCDTSHTQCVFEVSQVGVMTMLSVCVVRCRLVWICHLCVSVMSVPCVSHTAHSWQTHTSDIFTQQNSTAKHTLLA